MSDDSDPFGEAMDKAEAANEQNSGESYMQEFDVEAFLEELDSGEKDAFVTIRVTEEMRAVWQQLRNDEEVSVKPSQSVREWIMTQAERHPETARRAGMKLAIDRGE